MSNGGIGDYIHFHVRQYLSWGINEDSKNRKWGADAYYNYGYQIKRILEQVSAHKSGITEHEKRALETSIEYIMSDKKKGDNYLDVAKTDIMNSYFREYVDPYIRGEIAQASLKVSTTSMQQLRQKLKKVLASQHQQIVKTKKDLELEINTILVSVNTFLANDKSFNKENRTWQDTMEQIQNLKNKILNLDKDAKYIFSDCYDAKAYPDGSQQLDNLIKDMTLAGAGTRPQYGLIGELNNLYNIIFKLPAIPLQQGDLLEYAVQYVAYEAMRIGGNKLVESVKNLGKENVDVKINTNEFFNDFELYDSTFDIYEPLGNGEIRIVKSPGTQQKIDIQYTFLNSDSNFNFSAKNYALKSPSQEMSVVSGTSLLFLIQNQNHGFINHYLNLIVNHPADANYEGSLNQQRLLAQKEMLFTIVYQALTGDTEGRTEKYGFTNLFIVNNNLSSAAGSVRVYDMEDILYTIANDLNNIDKYLNVTIDGIKIYDFKIEQQWAGSKAARINNILNSLGQKKVHATVKAKALTGMVYK